MLIWAAGNLHNFKESRRVFALLHQNDVVLLNDAFQHHPAPFSMRCNLLFLTECVLQ